MQYPKYLSNIAYIKIEYTNAPAHYMNPKKQRTKWNTVWLHIGIWTVYGCVDLLTFSLISADLVLDQDLLIEILINLLSGIFFFYTLLFNVFPSKKVRHVNVLQLLWKLILAVICCMLLRRGAMLLLAYWTDFESVAISNYKFFMVSGFDLLIKFGTYAALVWFFQRQGELQKQVLQKELDGERLQNELLVAEQAVLKAQINPHFLFNILNFIRAKTISNDGRTVDKTVLLLSDVLRHAIKDSSKRKPVPVLAELEHIKKLHEINSLRFNGRYFFKITDQGSIYDKKTPPFILLTFYENAMKHGVFDDPKNPVLLNVKQTQNNLEITLINKIQHPKTINNHAKFAIGKRYIKNILEQFHKNNYILEYQNDGIFHKVYLKINDE